MKKVQRRLAVTMASLLIIECLLTPLSLWADSLPGKFESFVSPDYATIGSKDESYVINDEEQGGEDDRSTAPDVDSASSVSDECGSTATDSTNSEKGSSVEFGSIAYQAHVQDIGWQDVVSDGMTAGATGRAKRVEALKINLLARDGSPFENDSISVQAHVSGIGWDARPVGNGQVSGTVGQSRAIEAIKLTLSSNLSDTYDIWYRVHSANVGWLGWTSNGEPAGTQGYAYPIEAIQIKVILKNAQDAPARGDAFKDRAQEPPTVSYRSHVSRVESVQVKIVPKGAGAPGATGRPFTDQPLLPADMMGMLNRANRYSSNTNWLIMVDRQACRLGVFRGQRGSWSYAQYWTCSTGAPSTPTPTGEYTVTGKGYSFGHGYTCYYYTQFYGDYLFHSIPYYQGTFNPMDSRMGMHISQGCVRLPIDRAKWIWDNVSLATKVVIY